MELRGGTFEEIAEMRREKLALYQVPLLPEFHAHLTHHSDVHVFSDGGKSVGYALLLRERHETHEHLTVLELYLTPAYADSYEDAVDFLRDRTQPRVYLARSDECTVMTALLAHGYPLEVSMSLMVARVAQDPGPSAALDLVPLDAAAVPAAHRIFVQARVPKEVPSMAELERAVGDGAFWVLLDGNSSVGLLIRQNDAGGRYSFLDIMAPGLGEREQVWGLLAAGKMLERDGRSAAAVLDSRETGRLELFRAAGYHTAATYLVFYDALAGRPSVDVLARDELWRMIQEKEQFRLIDVLGEAHWREGHLPGAEWLEFRNLSREAKHRYKKDEALVVYCNDYT
jgi:hypothetical protein